MRSWNIRTHAAVCAIPCYYHLRGDYQVVKSQPSYRCGHYLANYNPDKYEEIITSDYRLIFARLARALAINTVQLFCEEFLFYFNSLYLFPYKCKNKML